MRKVQRTLFGERCRDAREKKGMTQTEVVKALNLKRQSTIGDMETKAEGSVITAQLADLYGVHALWLATGQGPRDLKPAKSWRDEAYALAKQIKAEKGLDDFVEFCRIVDVNVKLGEKQSGDLIGESKVPGVVVDSRDKRTEPEPNH